MRALILAPFATAQIDRLRRRIDVTHESWLETRRLWDPAELGARLAAEDAAVLVIEADFAFSEMFEAAPCLRLVAVCRNALNQVDIEAARAAGVPVTHTPGRNTNAVAEMTIACMLALARRISEAQHLVSGGGWRDPALGYRELRGREISGSTVGVIGFGQIGREVARLCLALGASVRAHDPIVPARQIAALGAEPASLDALAASADFVTLHVPDCESTYHLVDAPFLAKLQPHAYLINTGAGSAVDPAALADALTRRRIAGAALDVFEGQPLPQSSPLMTAPNLLLTPHIAGATAETVERHSLIIADEIERLLDGRPLQHALNPDKPARAG
jgi:D-3-phosphoglycerate dehydrogenase / 2-oxoglutarate reductase